MASGVGVSAVIFDFDGTLVLSNRIKKETFFEVVSKVPLGVELMQEVLGRPLVGDRFRVFDEFVRLARRSGEDPKHLCSAESFSDLYTKLCHRKISNAPEVPGALDAIRILKKSGIPLFISSATPQVPLLKLVSARNLLSNFSGVYGSPLTKTDHIKRVLDHTGCSSDQILYVGDSEDDVVSARETGCRFVGVYTDPSRFSEKPKWTISNIREVLDFCFL